MKKRVLFIGSWLVLSALSIVSCTGGEYDGACGRPEGCGASTSNPSNGISCSDGVCTCSESGQVPCCPKGESGCAMDLMVCLPESECAAMKPECAWDEDCPGPPDSRCGVPRCVEGKCEMEIWAGEPIPNQFPGNCKVNVCSIKGEVMIWNDPGDIPMDANPCTTDLCDGDTPMNLVVPDKFPCPGLERGVCYKAECLECSVLLGVHDCPDGLVCAWDQCLPPQCYNGEIDGQETEKDCGGPVCHRCGYFGDCLSDSDCTAVCELNKCTEPSHTDGVKNSYETGVDCGYPGGPPYMCKDGEGCRTPADCESFVCYLGICQVPSCLDDIKNGDETGTDCGGGCPPCQN